MTAQQQMLWSINGAHYLLQTRVELLDVKLEERFFDKFPHFRSVLATQKPAEMAIGGADPWH
jgi:hypothetical protein